MKLWGRIDILHNNVGVSLAGGDAAPTEITEEAFDASTPSTCAAPSWPASTPCPMMRQQRSGSIINISSIAALAANYPTVAYKTTKAGMIAYTEQIAYQNAEFGVRCNAILPGLMDTPMAVDTRARTWGKTRAEVAAMRDARVPLRGAWAPPGTWPTQRCSWPPTRPTSSPASPCPSTAAAACARSDGSSLPTSCRCAGPAARPQHRPALLEVAEKLAGAGAQAVAGGAHQRAKLEHRRAQALGLRGRRPFDPLLPDAAGAPRPRRVNALHQCVLPRHHRVVGPGKPADLHERGLRQHEKSRNQRRCHHLGSDEQQTRRKIWPLVTRKRARNLRQQQRRGQHEHDQRDIGRQADDHQLDGRPRPPARQPASRSASGRQPHSSNTMMSASRNSSARLRTGRATPQNARSAGPARRATSRTTSSAATPRAARLSIRRQSSHSITAHQPHVDRLTPFETIPFSHVRQYPCHNRGRLVR